MFSGLLSYAFPSTPDKGVCVAADGYSDPLYLATASLLMVAFIIISVLFQGLTVCILRHRGRNITPFNDVGGRKAKGRAPALGTTLRYICPIILKRLHKESEIQILF